MPINQTDTYIRYVQNVLGAKSIVLPDGEEVAVAEPAQFWILTEKLEEPSHRELFDNIIRALGLENFRHLELAVDDTQDSSQDFGLEQSPVSGTRPKTTFVLFGASLKKFVHEVEGAELSILKGLVVTHSIASLIENPNLKRETWDALKKLKN